jgi:hypothetical protein
MAITIQQANIVNETEMVVMVVCLVIEHTLYLSMGNGATGRDISNLCKEIII